MKQIKLIAMVMALMLFLTACGGGSKIPDGFTEETYDLGCKALDLMDKYNSAEISKDDCYGRLDSIRDALDKIHDQKIEGDRYSNSIAIDISSFILELVKPGEYTTSDTFTPANSLRKLLKK